MKLISGCATYVGNTRNINQDAVLLRSTEKDGQYFLLLVVCDGIGGLEKGEIASALVVRQANAWYDDTIQWLDIKKAVPEILNAHLKDAAEEWNLAVCDYRNVQGVNMGTTMSLLMIIRDRYYIIQVGDSRIYQYRDDKLLQLTVDASVSRMKNGRMKVYLDNFMGKSNELWFTSTSGNVEDGDLFLVCSDGLYHHLCPEDVREIRKDACNIKKIEAVCRQMIDKMMRRGERDNISIGIITAEKRRYVLKQREKPER